MNFKEIEVMTQANYQINVNWNCLKDSLDRYKKAHFLDMNPDFQRDFVWTNLQKTEYVEYILRGGISGKDIYFNQRGWMGSFEGKMVLVDGMQRINAVLDYLDDKIKAFGKLYSEMEGFIPLHVDFLFHINDLESRRAVLNWYLDLNNTGTSHTVAEIDKVKDMIKGQKWYESEDYEGGQIW